jgi:hypothetical protein
MGRVLKGDSGLQYLNLGFLLNFILSLFFSDRRVLRRLVIIGLSIFIVSCGGGGGGSSDDEGSSGDQTAPPTTTTPPEDRTLNLGAPSPSPAVLPPSADATQVTFLSVVSGSIYPDRLSLDEVNEDGDVITAGVAFLRDDGEGADVYRGDRVYTGTITEGSVNSVERFYRVSADNDGEEVLSGRSAFWVSGCPVRARPSNPQQAVLDSQTGAFIFANEVLMTVSDGVAPVLEEINRIAGDVNGRVVGCIPLLRQYLLEIEGDGTAEGVYDAIDTLLPMVEVESASPNARVEDLPQGEPLTCTGRECQWYLERIQAPEAWSIGGAGDEQQSVAVIDFGIDCTHPELECDGNVYNQDYIDHGTGVASLIGANNIDNTDFAGVAWNTDLYPYSFLGQGGSQYKLSELITLSLGEDSVKVINISATSAIDANNQIRDAICSAIDSGRLVVAAAGNAVTSNSCEISNSYPAAYNTLGQCPNGADLRSGLLVVGATDIDNNLAEWDGNTVCSNTLHVDLFAPGKDIFTASAEGDYATKNGTSYAAPLVAGSAAVVWSANPEFNVNQIHDQLLTGSTTLSNQSTNPLAQTSDARVDGQPLLNLYRALGGVEDAPAPDITPDAIIFTSQDGVSLNAVVTSESVVVQGIDTSTTIDVINGFYSVDGEPFTNAAGSIANGQSLRLQLTSAPAPNTLREVEVIVGGERAIFQVTTELPDITPDNFDFFNVVEAGLDIDVVSNELVIPGINTNTPISIDGGEYSTDGGVTYSSAAGNVSETDTIRLRVRTAEEPETTTSATVTIGGVDDVFSVTTEAVDISPEPFFFVDEVDVPLNTERLSPVVTVVGINTGAVLSVSGGEYAIAGGSFTSDTSVIESGQTVQVRQRSAGVNDSTTFTTLTVGDYSATYSLRTVAGPDNVAPIVTDLSITDTNGGSALVGDTLAGFYTFFDADEDSEGVSLYQWLRDGDVIAGANTLTYILSAADSGSTISLEVTPVAQQGVITGDEFVSTGITVENSAPTVSSVSINDDNGGAIVVGDTLSGTYLYSDADGDPEGASTFRWLRNNTAITGAISASYTLTPADAGQLITFEVTPAASSGITFGGAVSSGAITTNNSAPIATNVTVSDVNGGGLFVGDMLTGSYIYSDIDNDAEGTSTFRWLRDGAPIGGATAISYTVVTADVGTAISFEVTPVAAAGTTTGAAVSSASITTDNSAPVATNVSITDLNGGSVVIGDTLSGNYTYSDIDGDSEGASLYQWYRDAAPIAGAVTTTYTINSTDVGRVISFEVVPVASSGLTTGAAVSSSGITPDNSAPTASSVSISDGNGNSIVVGDVLDGNYVFNDVDGDAEGSSVYQWFRGGSPISGANSQSYTLTAADAGQSITFSVTPVATSGTTTGTTVISGAVFVDNSAPVASSVTITNSGSVAVGDVLNGSYSYGDVDGDIEGATTFRWLRNGAAISGATAQSYTLVAADSGQNIAFEVTPIAQSGLLTGSAVASSNINVSNSAPTADNVSINDDNGGSVVVGDTLRGEYLYSDIDGDPEGATSFRWLRNGSAIGGATSQTYTLVAADSGQNISFEVTPVAQSGTAQGVPALSGSLTTNNSAPTVSGVTIRDDGGPGIVVGELIFGDYTYEDIDGDLQGSSTFRWLRNGSPIAGATAQAYTTVLADSGQTITFEVTPVAQTGTTTGNPALSSGVSINNSAPTANGLQISDTNGGNPLVGDALRGEYNYSDVDGDAEGTSTFRWLRGGTPISGATSINYLLVSADSGQEIAFEVTPVAASGVGVGVPVVSTGVTIDNSPPRAISPAIIDENGGNALVGDQLRGDYTYSDPDNDAQGQSLFRWLRNGSPISGATAFTYTLSAADSGQSITFEVTPVAVSGVSTGTAVVSNELEVANSAPEASDVSISDGNGGSVIVGDVLTGNYTYSDQDGDAEGPSAFRWLRNGSAISGATAQSYTVTSADGGQEITFEVTPAATVGANPGAPVTSTSVTVLSDNVSLASLEISIGDLLPSFEPEEVIYGVILPSNEPSIDVTVTTQDPNATVTIHGADATSGVPLTHPLNEGFNAFFIIVTAEDGVNDRFYQIEILNNTAPTVTNVTISDSNGGLVEVSDVLTGSYDYEDTEFDVEGSSTFRWLRGGSPIAGATTTSYTLTEADAGQNISFEVTPVAATGVLVGTPVVSSAITVEALTELAMNITFPPAGTNYGGYTSSITVSGSITDSGNPVPNSDITSVTINGQSATLDSARPGRWSVQLPVSLGTNTLSGQVVTVNGPASVEQSLQNEVVFRWPESIVYDDQNDRLIVVNTTLDSIVSINLSSGTSTVLSNDSVGSGPRFEGLGAIELDLANNRLLVVDGKGLYSVNLSNGNRTTIADNEIGAGFQFNGAPRDIVLDVANNRILAVSGVLYSIDLASGDREVLVDRNGFGDVFGEWLSLQGVLVDTANNQIIVISSGSGAQDPFGIVYGVDPATNEATRISYISRGSGPSFGAIASVTLDPNVQNNQVIVASRNGFTNIEFYSVDLDSGDRTFLSSTSVFTNSNILVSGLLTFDLSENRALGLSTLGTLRAIDLSDGTDQTLFSQNESDRLFVRDQTINVDDVNNRILFIDLTLDALMSFNPLTGISTIVSDDNTGTGLNLDTVATLAVDSINNRAIGIRNNDALSIDLSSGDRTLIDVTGESVSSDRGVAMNTNNGQLLVSSSASFNHSLLTVDLDTGVSSAVSSPDVGSGPLLEFLQTPPAIDALNNIAYLANESQLLEVDLDDGARRVIYDSDVSASNIWVNPSALALDSNEDRVLIKANSGFVPDRFDYSSSKALIAIDLTTASLSIVSGVNIGNGIQLDLDSFCCGLALDDENRRLITQSGSGLIFIDLLSGDRVIMTNYQFVE